MERGNRKEKVRKKKEKKGKRNEIRIDEKKHKNISPKKWLNNYPLVSEWLSQFGNIEKRVEENGGILAIDHFLPSQVAMFAYQVFQFHFLFFIFYFLFFVFCFYLIFQIFFLFKTWKRERERNSFAKFNIFFERCWIRLKIGKQTQQIEIQKIMLTIILTVQNLERKIFLLF